MRLLSWNINGIRTLPMYHPWNTLKSGDGILNELAADIICFQEVKSTRQSIDKSIALPESYDAFFSFPLHRGGYSGVAVFTKSSEVVSLKAEEGITGRLQPLLRPRLSASERISKALPQVHDMDLMLDGIAGTHNLLDELDHEGRAIMLDFGLFVLINVYCPNETSDIRLPYKMNFHLVLEERVRLLVEVDKREVIVVGDINVCATPMDHCEGELPSNKETFWEHPARKWFHEWLHPLGPMVDVVRNCWPDRKKMYTCWNQKIDARTTNYGTRIDYFLLTKGLLPWFKHGDIQPSVKGSDHCPVYIDLHDEIVDEDGKRLFLKDLMKMNGERRDPPRLSTRFWHEYAGKQKLLSNFFAKKGTADANSDSLTHVPATVPSAPEPSSMVISPVASVESQNKVEVKTCEAKVQDESSSTNQEVVPTPTMTPSPSNLIAFSVSTSVTDGLPNAVTKQSVIPPKRKMMQADSNYPPVQASKKSKKGKGGNNSMSKLKSKDCTIAQRKLSSFFADPAPSQNQAEQDDDAERSDARRSTSKSPAKSDVIDVDALLNDADDVDYELLSQQPSPSLCVPGSSSQGGKGKNPHAWSTLFARIEPPKCTVHREPAHEFKVNKPGPNKGKAFFICARPVGPGYDAGKDRRRREEVNSQYRCNFFKWSSEVKRDALREADSQNGG